MGTAIEDVGAARAVLGLNIPRDKTYPPDAVQCRACYGWGCRSCQDRGWFPHNDPRGLICTRRGCFKPVPAGQLLNICSDACRDADITADSGSQDGSAASK